MHQQSSFLALDVGQRRIGVAVADANARLPRPLTTLEHTPTIIGTIANLITEHHVQAIVVGLPRGMAGQRTQQTDATDAFIAALKAKTTIPIHTQDEAVTSAQAEQELRERGKPYTKKDIDALAATYILEDFLRDKL